MVYLVKVYDNYCCACRGGGVDDTYTRKINVANDEEVLKICALSKFLDYHYSDRDCWLNENILKHIEENYNKETFDERDYEEFKEGLEDILENPLEWLENNNDLGLDGGWECLISIKRYRDKDYLFYDGEIDEMANSLDDDDFYW